MKSLLFIFFPFPFRLRFSLYYCNELSEFNILFSPALYNCGSRFFADISDHPCALLSGGFGQFRAYPVQHGRIIGPGARIFSENEASSTQTFVMSGTFAGMRPHGVGPADETPRRVFRPAPHGDAFTGTQICRS